MRQSIKPLGPPTLDYDKNEDRTAFDYTMRAGLRFLFTYDTSGEALSNLRGRLRFLTICEFLQISIKGCVRSPRDERVSMLLICVLKLHITVVPASSVVTVGDVQTTGQSFLLAGKMSIRRAVPQQPFAHLFVRLHTTGWPMGTVLSASGVYATLDVGFVQKGKAGHPCICCNKRNFISSFRL